MTIVNKTKVNGCWQGYGEKETLDCCWWEYKVIDSLWKSYVGFLNILKIKLPYDPAIPLIGIYPKQMK
jgi:hypothetical protein